jgi:hypothetical protein
MSRYGRDDEDAHYRAPRDRAAFNRAKAAVDEWGHQPPVEVLGAMVEEFAELINEIVVDELPDDATDTEADIWSGLLAVHSACYEFRGTLREHYRDAAGDALPADERPTLPAVEQDKIDVDASRDELLDVLALCTQLDWAFYQGVRAGDRNAN